MVKYWFMDPKLTNIRVVFRQKGLLDPIFLFFIDAQLKAAAAVFKSST